MPIEIEIGFKLTETLIKERLLNDITSAKVREPAKISMVAEYYDTPAQLLLQNGAAMRRRLENGDAYVTMKSDIRNGGRLMERNIWECKCSEVSAALGTLLDMGAPQELLNLLSAEGLVSYGRFRYTRNRFLLMLDEETAVEVNFDEGVILSNEKQSDFSDVLFKLLYGSKETLEKYVIAQEEKYGLTRELVGKYERVLRLIRSR